MFEKMTINAIYICCENLDPYCKVIIHDNDKTIDCYMLDAVPTEYNFVAVSRFNIVNNKTLEVWF